MGKAISVEIRDKRDFYLLNALKKEGFTTFDLGEESKYKEFEKVYVRSLLTSVTREIAESLEDNSILFSRKLSDEVDEIIKQKNIEQYNLLSDETFIVKNAYLTAEGALAHIILNTQRTIRHMPILVLGYGRVGKSVTKLLKDNYAIVSVATNDPTEYAIASIFSDDVHTLDSYKENLNNFSAIINTVPKLILEGETLNLINKDCFILDLASLPGGIDYNAAEKLNLNLMHALGVPGKVAPETAGLYIKDIIMKRLSNRL
jgi:dipicolinate synthase subunit A